MSFSDLLELVLDLTDRLVFELLDLLKRASDHTKGLRIDARCSQYLVSLSVLRLQALLYSLQLFLKDEIAQAGLPMYVIDDTVESLEQLFLLLLDVLVLLQHDLVLPLLILVLLLAPFNLILAFGQLASDLVVQNLALLKTNDLLFDMLKRLNNHIVLGMLDHLLTVCAVLIALLGFEIGAQSGDHIHV